MEAASAAAGADSVVRTRHRNSDGSPQYTNRLILESSPYLQQHAHNPVNWYPWGDEAFDAAKRLKRPVLLSVGYSTCHWCHVMEEESFEDEEITRYLNEHYVAIKVDREERPDVDAVYMSAVQALTGRGGWPMTVWLTPERKPFYAGTYFPARDGERGVRMGFLTLLQKLQAIYHDEPNRVSESAAQLVRAVKSSLAPPSHDHALPDATVMQAAAAAARSRFDPVHGGTTGAPKFPSDLPIRFLLRYHRRRGDAPALAMAEKTLEEMAAGGIYDHVGGGFHRYSTDAQWMVPHFEKMLYGNALLVMAYLEGYQATGRDGLAGVARETLRYVEREMTSPGGGFYSASDADSLAPGGKRVEGWFYTWTPAEIEAAVGEKHARIVDAYFHVTGAGNFGGRNVLYAPKSVDQVAADLKLPAEELRQALDDSTEALYAARAKRPPPLRDDKVLAAWNGLMISAFARASLALGDPHDAQVAAQAASFVLSKMRRNGRLLRTYRQGRAEHDGYLNDYAFFSAGLLDLYEASGDLRWLREAIALDRVLASHYEDRKGGGFFMTADDAEALLAREKPGSDGAEPSGNSVEALNLLRLYELTTDERYRVRAENTFKAFGRILRRSPAAMSEMLLAVDYYLDAPKEVVIVTPSSHAEAEPFLAVLRRTFLPNRVLSLVSEGNDLAAVAKLVPLVAEKIAQGGKPTAYVCERQVCDLPTTRPEIFAKQIRKKR